MSDSTDDSVETVISALDSRLPQSLSPSGSLSPEDSISATPASPEPDVPTLTFDPSQTNMGNRLGGEKKKKKEDKPEEKKHEEKPKKKGKKSKGKSKRNSQNAESDGATAQGACALPSSTSPKLRKSNKRPDVLADLGAHSPGSTLGSPSSTTGSQGTWSLDDESDVSTLGYSTPLLSTPQVQRYVIQPQATGQQTSSERLEQLGRSIERTIVDNLTDVPPGLGTPVESPVSTSERPKGKRNVKKKRALGQAVLDCDPFKLPLQEGNQAAAPSTQTQKLNVGTEKISLRESQESHISPWLKDDDMPVDEEQMDEMFISCIDLSYNLADICSEKEFTEYGSLDSKRPAKPKTEKPKSKESSLSPSLVRKALDLNTSPWNRSPQMKLKLRAADSCDTPTKSDESSTSTLAESGLDIIPEPSIPECLTAATAQLVVKKEQDVVQSPSQAEECAAAAEKSPTEESSSATSPTSPQTEDVSPIVQSPGTESNDASQQSSKKKSGKSKSKSKSKKKKAKEKEKITSEVPCIKSDIPTNQVAPIAACVIEKGPEIKLIPKETTTAEIKKDNENKADEIQKDVTPIQLEPAKEDNSVICEKMSRPSEELGETDLPKDIKAENAFPEAATENVLGSVEAEAADVKDEMLNGDESKADVCMTEISSSVDDTKQHDEQEEKTSPEQATNLLSSGESQSQFPSEASSNQAKPGKDSPKTDNISPTEPASPKHVPPPSPSAMDALAEADEEDEECMEDNQQSKEIQLFGETVFKRLSSLVESQSQDEDQEDRIKEFSDIVDPDDLDSRPVDLGSMGSVPEFDKSSEGDGQKEAEMTNTNLIVEDVVVPGCAVTVEKSVVSVSAEVIGDVSQISMKPSDDIGETYFKEGNEEEPVDDDTLTRKKKKKPGQKKGKKEKQQGNVVKKPEIPKELKQISTSDNDSSSKSNEKEKHGRKKKKSESEKDPPKRASQQIQEVIDAYGLADDIVDVSVERMTDEDDDEDDFEEFRPRYEDDDDDSDTCDTKSSGLPSRSSVEASKYIPEIEETFSELLSVKHILEDLEDRTPTEEVLPPFVSSDGLRSPPDFLNGRRSRMSPAVTDRTESDLDISEQRDDISTDSMYADDEDDGTTEVLFNRSYSEPDGNEVVLSCTFYNTTHNTTDSDDFWEDYSTADESYKQIEVSADAASSTFQNARKQMHDIHQHLQDLRRQMEHLQEDVENATLTPEYSMDSEEMRFVTE